MRVTLPTIRLATPLLKSSGPPGGVVSPQGPFGNVERRVQWSQLQRGYYWALESGGEEYCSMCYTAQGSPCHRSSCQKVNSAEASKFCSRGKGEQRSVRVAPNTPRPPPHTQKELGQRAQHEIAPNIQVLEWNQSHAIFLPGFAHLSFPTTQEYK